MNVLILVIIGLVSNFRSELAFKLLIGCILLVPPTTGTSFFGYSYVAKAGFPPPISITNFLLFGIIINIVIFRLHKIRIFLKKIPGLIFIVLVIFVMASLQIKNNSSVSFFTEIFVTPILIFIVVNFFSLNIEDFKSKASNLLIKYLYFEIFIGAAEYVLNINFIPVQPSNGITLYKVATNIENRIDGTFDHPIIYALFVGSIIPFALKKIEKRKIKLTVISTSMLVVIASGSRLGLIFNIINILISTNGTKLNHLKSILTSSILMLLAILFYFNLFKSKYSVFNRFVNDNQSLSLRLKSWSNAKIIMKEHFFSGVGAGQSRYLNILYGTGISFESFPIIWIIEYGFIFAFFMMFLAIININRLTSLDNINIKFVFYTLFVSLFFFSSIAVKSQTIWVVSLLLAIYTTEKRI